VRWRSLFRSTSLGKRCTSYNAPPTSRKRSYGRFKRTLFRMAEQYCWSVSVARLKSDNECAHRDRGTTLEHPSYSPDLVLCDFWAFLTMKRELRGQNCLFHYPPEACGKRCSTFSRSGWSVVRSASLAKGGTSKTRPSPHLHEVTTRSNKVSTRTLQTALVH
jgi:hypothetical protein